MAKIGADEAKYLAQETVRQFSRMPLDQDKLQGILNGKEYGSCFEQPAFEVSDYQTHRNDRTSDSPMDLPDLCCFTTRRILVNQYAHADAPMYSHSKIVCSNILGGLRSWLASRRTFYPDGHDIIGKGMKTRQKYDTSKKLREVTQDEDILEMFKESLQQGHLVSLAGVFDRRYDGLWVRMPILIIPGISDEDSNYLRKYEDDHTDPPIGEFLEALQEERVRYPQVKIPEEKKKTKSKKPNQS
jgi:hypothetical protein